MASRFAQMARITAWAMLWLRGLGLALPDGRPRRVRITESQLDTPPDTAGLAFLILAQHGVCFSPGPELPGVALLRHRRR